jgi:hypothetical protein
MEENYGKAKQFKQWDINKYVCVCVCVFVCFWETSLKQHNMGITNRTTLSLPLDGFMASWSMKDFNMHP